MNRRPNDERCWLTARMAIAIHGQAIALVGGAPGIRDAGLLDSALDRPRNLAAYGDAPTIFDLAAAYCVGIVRNHPFVDGNKRTGYLTAHVFLGLNGIAIEPEEADIVTYVEGVAAGTVDEAHVAQWLAQASRDADVGASG
jgi:death-on-curing protein